MPCHARKYKGVTSSNHLSHVFNSKDWLRSACDSRWDSLRGIFWIHHPLWFLCRSDVRPASSLLHYDLRVPHPNMQERVMQTWANGLCTFAHFEYHSGVSDEQSNTFPYRPLPVQSNCKGKLRASFLLVPIWASRLYICFSTLSFPL